MKLIFHVIAGLFVLKLIWNVGVPIDIFLRSRKGKFKKESGVSLMPVEVLLLIILFVCSFYLNDDNFYCRPLGVLLIGIVSVAFSYILMLVIGKVLRE